MNTSDQVRIALEELASSSLARYRTAEDRITAVVRDAVSAGVFLPGQRLPQDTLASLLNVSRMPVRAALRRLESEGLVDLIPHRGALVRTLSRDEIQDLYEMRILIETYALRKTVAAMTPRAFAELKELAERMDMASTPSEWIQLRDDFYRKLYAIGNTPRVVKLIMQFRAEVGSHLKSVSHEGGNAHRPLLEYIEQSDPDLAASWLETHLREIAASLRSRFSASEETDAES